MSRFITRLFAFSLLLVVIASPMVARGTAAQEATPCAPMTEEEATAWITAYYAAWNSHDPANVTALYAPDAIHHWDIGIDSEGADELTTSLEAFFTAFPGVRFTIDRVWMSGDAAIVRWIAIGIQEGDFLGVPASLDTVTWTGISILLINCGLVTESWSESDNFSRLEQMGIIVIGPEAEATPAG